MMYNHKMAFAIKTNGKVLREINDTVFIPFGAEYSVFLKNLNSVRAQVRITVDGQDATEGVSLVIGPNSEMNLERFIKNGNLNAGNSFKFIERTAGIEQHRGIQVEDGLIRVEFQFEKVLPKPVTIPVIHEHHHHDYWPHPWPYYEPPYRRWYSDRNPDRYKTEEIWCDTSKTTSSPLRSKFSNSMGDSEVHTSGLNPQTKTAYNMSQSVRGIQCSTGEFSNEKMSKSFSEEKGRGLSEYRNFVPQNEVGITVPGSKSNQQFNWVSDFDVEDEVHVIVLKILGETQAGKKVQQAVVVKTKSRCVTCGKANKATNKCCSECGTSLEIV